YAHFEISSVFLTSFFPIIVFGAACQRCYCQEQYACFSDCCFHFCVLLGFIFYPYEGFGVILTVFHHLTKQRYSGKTFPNTPQRGVSKIPYCKLSTKSLSLANN